ncbi:MAG: isopeptide-forming domain-containing fimbrial protein [Tyzzerella sp.]|nr:isopeptide-forming domain-containing fimbrial protein [Tyzzerella sp.]
MKKMKKLVALLLAVTTVLGTSLTTFAAKPAATDKVLVTVTNVESGAEVTAYQIIEGAYGGNGFLGYKEAKPTTGTLELFTSDYLTEESDLPTSSEVTDIAAKINAGTLVLANSVELDETESTADVTSYTANLTAGYWVVLVRGTVHVYNPMLVGVYYKTDESGDDNSLVPDVEVDATDHWTLVTNNAYAKSSEPSIEKTASVQTQHVGETVDFTITTTIPDYSEEYDSAVFTVTDKLTHLVLTTGEITVSIDGEEVTNPNGIFKITGNTKDSTTFTIAFEKDWLLEREADSDIAANAGKSIEITYTGTVTEEAVNDEAAENEAVLTYTHNPGEHDGKDKDIEKVYSFDIDAGVTKQVITKVKEDAAKPLAGATFKLYTNIACTEEYEYSNTATNDDLTEDGVVSDAEGQLHISGLNVGTYYLKETIAPNGYSLNDTIYKIVIAAEIDNDTDELESWSIVVTPVVKDAQGNYEEQTEEAAANNFTIESGAIKVNDDKDDSTEDGINETQVMNLKLVSLPSTGGIGTTIFTIAGCGIMITAAGLFFVNRRKDKS